MNTRILLKNSIADQLEAKMSSYLGLTNRVLLVPLLYSIEDSLWSNVISTFYHKLPK